MFFLVTCSPSICSVAVSSRLCVNDSARLKHSNHSYACPPFLIRVSLLRVFALFLLLCCGQFSQYNSRDTGFFSPFFSLIKSYVRDIL